MQNRVGDNAPTQAVLEQLVTELTAIVTALKQFGIVLDIEERKRLLHARRDADPMVQRVRDLAAKYSVALPQIPLAGMMNDQALRNRLHPLTDLFRTGLVLSEDTEGQAESEMWEAYLAYYGVLSKMAEQNPTLAVELAPVVEFMSNRRKAAKKEEPKS